MKQTRREFLKSVGLGFLIGLLPAVPEPEPEEPVPGDPKLPPSQEWLVDGLSEPEASSSHSRTYTFHPGESCERQQRRIYDLGDPKLDSERLP